MRFLLDTNALSEPARKRPSQKFMERFLRFGGQICTSVLCIGEMVYGARRSRARVVYDEYLRDVILPRTPVLDVDLEIATTYGGLRATCERAGHPTADVDLLIAATAISRDLILVTRNLRDFEAIETLQTVDWTV